MTEEQVFLAVLDLPDATSRDDYLDGTCGGDAAFRRQVEALLAAHFRSGEFLDVPAAEQIKPDSTHDIPVAIEGATVPTDQDTEDESRGLQFLTPSTRPDSLGRLGHYEVLQVLGRGGFGIVFRAFDDILQRVVAVKMMAPQIACLSPARKRFVREAQSSAKVRHENVVQVYEVGEQPLPYLVMEFIPGETLQQKLDRNGPLDVSEILRIGRHVAEGLAAAHACDLIHRDIKPGNILLEGGSHKVKITDFGLARAADDASISHSGIIAGTPNYMSPEQAKGEKIDQRADLFSLGSVLYQMASGRPPFRAPSVLAVLKRVAEESPRPIPEIIPETPDWLCGIIAKLHAKDPDERFQSAREVADLLADCEAKLKAKQEVKNILPASPSGVKPAGRKWVAAAAVLLLPVIALAVTEFAGVTQLFREKQSAQPQPLQLAKKEPLDPTQLNGEPTAVVVAKKESPDPVAPRDPDRRAAEWVLSMGGTIQVNGASRSLQGAVELPPEPIRLTYVHLNRNEIANEGDLAHFQACKNLVILHLEFTKVTDAGLANFKNCKALLSLNLSGESVSDAGLVHFKDCNLTQLRLYRTNASDAGLAYFKDCKNMTVLALNNMPMTDAGLAHFKDCKKLTSVDLARTQVSDQGLVQFHDCKNLVQLLLQGTTVTAAGIDELKKALPKCKIEWDGDVIEPTAAEFGKEKDDK